MRTLLCTALSFLALATCAQAANHGNRGNFRGNFRGGYGYNAAFTSGCGYTAAFSSYSQSYVAPYAVAPIVSFQTYTPAAIVAQPVVTQAVAAPPAVVAPVVAPVVEQVVQQVVQPVVYPVVQTYVSPVFAYNTYGRGYNAFRSGHGHRGNVRRGR